MFVVIQAVNIPKIIGFLTEAYRNKSKIFIVYFFNAYVGVCTALTFSKSYLLKISLSPKFMYPILFNDLSALLFYPFNKN